MANIVLNSASLLDAAKKMEDAANRIDNAMKRLDSIMSDMDAVWSDENSRQYLTRYTELKEEFPAFKEAARSYSVFLNGVVQVYRQEFLDETASAVN